MAQVVARIVVAQAGNAAPGGYVDGGRDDLVVGSLITLTNADNAGALGHKWVITPCAALTLADYAVSGTESPTCTLTPASPDGYGDAFVELTVYGPPLANGAPNVAIDRIPLGIRVPVSGYAPGIPIPSEKETSAGGRGTLSQSGGREHRLQEAIYATAKQLKSSGIGDTTTIRAQNGEGGTPSAYVSGGVTIRSGVDWMNAHMDVGTKVLTLTPNDVVFAIKDEDGNEAVRNVVFKNTDSCTWAVDPVNGWITPTIATGGGGGGSGVDLTRNSTPLTGPTVDFVSGDGVVLSGSSTEVSFDLDNATTIRSIQKFGDTPIFGAATLKEGTGVTISQSGQDLTFNASRFRDNVGTYVSGDVSFSDSTSIGVSRIGNVFSFAGMRLRANAGAYAVLDVTVADTASITASLTSNVLTLTGFALPTGYEIVLSSGTIFHRYTGSVAGVGNALSFVGQQSTNDNGGALSIVGGIGAGTAKHGGHVSLIGGAHPGGAGAPGKGGDVAVRGGTSDNDASGGTYIGFAHGGSGTASGGPLNMGGGNASGAANGGPVTCFGGAGPIGAKTTIGGGKGTSGAGGDLELGSGFCTTGTSKVSIGTFDTSFNHVSWCTVEAGRLTVRESTAVVKQISETCAPVTTTSTTATLVWSYALGTSESLRITVQAEGDPGTAAAYGAVTYTAAFRRTTGDNSGAAQQCGTTQDVSPNGGVAKNGMAVTIALNSNTIEVKVVAPNSTSTLWSVGVGGQGRTGPV